MSAGVPVVASNVGGLREIVEHGNNGLLVENDAQAIVDYRTAHGKFMDAAALSKVPGIDKARIEEQPEALRFN